MNTDTVPSERTHAHDRHRTDPSNFPMNAPCRDIGTHTLTSVNGKPTPQESCPEPSNRSA